MYSPRIKTYLFGSLTATTTGALMGSTAHPITGELIKIIVDNINTAATGSVFVQTIPIGNAYFTHGSIINTASDQEIYFGVAAQKGRFDGYPVVNDTVFLSGAGFGNGSSILAALYYR